MRLNGITLIEADALCDYIPLVSTVSNLIDLFQKIVYNFLPEPTQKEHYWTHIHDKSALRSIVLLLPIIGNSLIFMADFFVHRKEKNERAEEIRFKKTLQETQAGFDAITASMSSGHVVRAAEMMPAPTDDQQRLWAACRDNNPDALNSFLKKGISPNFFHKGRTPLETACENGATEIVRLLLAHRADVNLIDRFGNTAFGTACSNGFLDIIELLRPHISDVDHKIRSGFTPLMLASLNGHYDVVDYLIQEGANSKIKTFDGGDALAYAIFNGHTEVLPLLIDDQENIDERDYPSFGITGITPLFFAAMLGQEDAAIKLLHRSEITNRDSAGRNIFHYCSKNLRLLQTILLDYADRTADLIDVQNSAGSTPLHRALELEQPEAAFILLEHGANPFIASGSEEKPGKTALLIAAEKGYQGFVETIFQKYSDEITEELKAEIRAVLEAPKEPKKEPVDIFSRKIDMFKKGVECLQSAQKMLKNHYNDVLPSEIRARKGMEILFGQLDPISLSL